MHGYVIFQENNVFYKISFKRVVGIMNNKKLKTSKVIIDFTCAQNASVYKVYAIFNSITYLRNYFKTYGSIENTEMSFISLNLSFVYIVFMFFQQFPKEVICQP